MYSGNSRRAPSFIPARRCRIILAVGAARRTTPHGRGGTALRGDRRRDDDRDARRRAFGATATGGRTRRVAVFAAYDIIFDRTPFVPRTEKGRTRLFGVLYSYFVFCIFPHPPTIPPLLFGII